MVRPTEEIDACVAAHRRVLTTVERLRDDDVRAPSLLPGWSRAHVIAHLARNADSHVWLFEGARIGEIRHQYPRAGMRETDIEASSAQTADALVHDLRRSCDALERAWHDLDDDLWERECVVTTGSRAVSELVFRRLREVEVHHVDLGEAYSSADWPDTYVEGELRRRLAGLASRADHRALVEWLIGRQPAPELGRW
jgi:maleylpyruvate isomerase